MSTTLTDFGDVWIGGYYTDYFNSIYGQIEYWGVMFMIAGYKMNSGKFPMNWYGKYNNMMLYLTHWGYSPFVDHPKHKWKQLASTEW